MSRGCTLLLFLVVVAVAAALPSPTPPSCACRDTVRPAVLYELYESLNGPYWRNNSGWSSFNYSDSNASDICTWYAVSCNEEDRTIAVFLYDNNASGVLPPGLGRLGPALVALWIQDTTEQAFLNPPVTGALPRGWGALTAITTLQLWGAFNGSLPLEWANMTSLVALSLGPGSLSGPIPDAWCAWTRLEQLALRNNALSGALPSCMPTSMPNLMALDVTSNFLTGPIPAGFANATSLVHFMVGSNLFTSEPFPAWFGLLPNIMTLDLSGTLYTGPLPAVWGAATTLQTINLANTFINDAIPNSWATLPSLRTMLADNASVTGRLPRRWVSSELSYFSFRSNSITGPLPEFDSPLPLQVNLAHNQFTGRVPLSYLNVTFEHLDLSHNSLQGTPDLCAITHHSQAAAMLMYNNFTGRVADLSCFGPKDPCSNQTLLTQYLEGNSFCGFCTLPPCP